MQSYLANDQICFEDILGSTLSNEERSNSSSVLKQCFDADFYATYSIVDNWNLNFNLGQIGGIIGIGRNATNLDYDSFWVNATAEKTFTLMLRPSVDELSWLDTFNNSDPESFIMLGESNRYKDIDLKSLSVERWVFNIKNLTFGNGTNDQSIFYGKNLQQDQIVEQSLDLEQSRNKGGYMTRQFYAEVSLALNGLGLPRFMYYNFIT